MAIPEAVRTELPTRMYTQTHTEVGVRAGLLLFLLQAQPPVPQAPSTIGIAKPASVSRAHKLRSLAGLDRRAPDPSPATRVASLSTAQGGGWGERVLGGREARRVAVEGKGRGRSVEGGCLKKHEPVDVAEEASGWT